MKSVFQRTDDLFFVRASNGMHAVFLRIPEGYGSEHVQLSEWASYRETHLLLYALRSRVADFAVSVRRSRAKLAEVVSMEARR